MAGGVGWWSLIVGRWSKGSGAVGYDCLLLPPDFGPPTSDLGPPSPWHTAPVVCSFSTRDGAPRHFNRRGSPGGFAHFAWERLCRLSDPKRRPATAGRVQAAALQRAFPLRVHRCPSVVNMVRCVPALRSKAASRHGGQGASPLQNRSSFAPWRENGCSHILIILFILSKTAVWPPLEN